MAKMKAINPKVMAMRERFKDNPQQMQQEMMRIYREEKVNPMGGCLPIMVQIPVFIALYWVLLSSVEMRGAPWILWIHDLAAPDPYYILPVVMTLSTMLQTALNPAPPDPMQAKMMWIMPLAFSVMFFFFPAGLVLYWITNNVLSIAQQWLINTRMGVAGAVSVWLHRNRIKESGRWRFIRTSVFAAAAKACSLRWRCMARGRRWSRLPPGSPISSAIRPAFTWATGSKNSAAGIPTSPTMPVAAACRRGRRPIFSSKPGSATWKPWWML
jgi:YidC/Oxa1 family membrane protein insertase